MSRVVVVLLSLCLAACGTKTPLQMPDRPVPEPLLGNAKSAKPAAGQPAASTTNVSTGTKTNTANPQ